MTLTIVKGELPSFLEGFIDLDASILLAAEGASYSDMQQLRVDLVYPYDPSPPVAKIIAPKEHSIQCSSLLISGLTSTGNHGQPFYYKWEFTPFNPFLEKYS